MLLLIRTGHNTCCNVALHISVIPFIPNEVGGAHGARAFLVDLLEHGAEVDAARDALAHDLAESFEGLGADRPLEGAPLILSSRNAYFCENHMFCLGKMMTSETASFCRCN